MLMFCNSTYRANVKLKKINNQKRRSGIISQSIEFIDDQDFVCYPKTTEEENLIRAALERNEFLSNILHGRRLQQFIDCMYIKNISEDEIVVREGEKGAHLYVSKEGVFEITVKENYIDSFKDVRVFGELAILYSAKRLATVRSLGNGSVWVLDCPIFKKLIVKTAIEEQEEMVSFLTDVPKLNSVSKEKLYQVANLLRTEFYVTSTKIVTQGEVGDKFYIIRAGSVTVIKNGNKISELCKGQFFGELALLKDEFRKATVIADAPGTECLTLTRKQFIEHFGKLEEFINLKRESFNEEKPFEYTELNLSDFQVLDTLGIGGFGRVELVQHKLFENPVFALKSMKKMVIVGRSHQDQVYNEKNLQMACSSKFIVRLYRTFRDSKYIYLLLEVCMGGDLWSHMHRQKKRCFDEPTAKFYAGCVLEGLAYLHDRHIVYRDLKPENVMIHINGYLKLTDFGFAKKIDSKEKTYTFVGTAEYISPEIILNKGHNKGVDCWAFGVFIYELLVGRTPFRTSDPGYLQTYKLILKGIDGVTFPYYVSHKARNLIKKLCAPIASDRLGCQKSGIKDIKSHAWFTSINWYKLRNMELEPPFKPDLSSNVDTKYFEVYKENTSIPLDDFTSWDEEF